jgi:hypothetical protein
MVFMRWGIVKVNDRAAMDIWSLARSGLSIGMGLVGDGHEGIYLHVK